MPRLRTRKVLFRVDASVSIGTGHVVRCLALADELARRNLDPSFASRRASDRNDQIEDGGFPVMHLEGPDSNEWATINMQISRDARRRPLHALVLDHYGLGAEWLEGAQQVTARRVVVDDLANRILPCEILVNPGIGVERADYENLVPRTARLLLGPRFVLLRPSFRAARDTRRRAMAAVGTVLVTMGGSDPLNVTSTAIRAVQAALPAARIEVVLGALYRGDPVGGSGIRVHRAIGDAAMAQLMTTADLAIGAGGTTSWERCALGLPSIILRLARNQDAVASRLDAAGVALDGGPAEEVDVDKLSGLIRRLTGNKRARQRMSDRALDLIDGRGVERVAHHVEGVRVRTATSADARLLWRWANDPETRLASFHTELIDYPDHLVWLRDRLADLSCLLLIGWNGAGPLGQVRFDKGDAEAEVSISVASEHRTTVGSLLLESALRQFRMRSPRLNLVAKVKSDNGPSRRLFERAGFRLTDERRGVLRYHLSASSDAKPD